MAVVCPPLGRAAQLAALAAIAFALALTGCGGGPPDGTDPAAAAAPAEPIAEQPGPQTRCGEGVFWAGPIDGEMPPGAEFSTGFTLPVALEGFDLLCSTNWTFPVNDCQMDFATAYLDGGPDGARLDEIDEQLIAWSTAHGLEQTAIDMSDNTRSYGIDVNPQDGGVMTLLAWDAVSRYGDEHMQRVTDMAGLPLDGADVMVSWQVCPALQGWDVPPER